MPVIAYFCPERLRRDPQLMRMVAPTRLIGRWVTLPEVRSRHCFMTAYNDDFEDQSANPRMLHRVKPIEPLQRS
jgi:hypothetical protein